MRNPSPPPLTEDEKIKISADYIGDSLFSKKWVLTTLLKLYKHDSKDIYIEENNEKTEVDIDKKLELNEKFEDEICELWDITAASTDVAVFLYDNQGKDILLETLDKTQSPRLMEISFGILGNLMCVDRICISLCADEKLQESLFSYLKITDALSLVELTRMIFVCVSNKECLPVLLSSFCLHFETLTSIMKNTLNLDLLENIVNIIDNVFDVSNETLENCVSSVFLEAIQDTYSLLHKERKGDIIATLVHTLQVVSTVNKGVILLSEDENVGKFLCVCLSDQENQKIVIEQEDQFYSAIFSTLTCLLSVKPQRIMKLINENSNILHYLIGCLSRKMEQTDGLEDKIYLPIYMELLCDVYKTSEQMKGDNNNILKCLKDEEKHISVIIKNCQNSKLEEVKRAALDISNVVDEAGI